MKSISISVENLKPEFKSLSQLLGTATGYVATIANIFEDLRYINVSNRYTGHGVVSDYKSSQLADSVLGAT